VVAAEYSDAAISGASMRQPPGPGRPAGGRRRRPFDLVIAEELDRLTRSGGDAWDIFDDLKAAGVRIHTVSARATSASCTSA
jgi:site-specific DNA recombinase